MDVLEKLRTEICEVTFSKANGFVRTMVCTLIPDFLPLPEAATVPDRKYPDDLITVWDLEEDAWRSFKPSRVISIEASPE